MNTTTICIIGAGYVGGITAAIIAKQCPDINVYVYDIKISQINKWNSDTLPIFEPGLDEIIVLTRNKNLFFTTDRSVINISNIIIIAVNTYTKTVGIGSGFSPDLTAIEECVKTIANQSYSKEFVIPKIIVEKSTVPIKTSDIIHTLFIKHSKFADDSWFTILSSPEFLAEGTAIHDMMNPSRILIGGNYNAANIFANIYRRWVPNEKIILSNLYSSELTKLVSNAFLAQRVSSINSISAICDATGADVYEVANATGADIRIGDKFMRPGPGFGGSCFRKDILDLVYICQQLHLDEVAAYWLQVIKMNEYQQTRLCELILRKLNFTLTNKIITIFGIAFKKDTGDTRDAPATQFIKFLQSEHTPRIKVFDPQANANTLPIESTSHSLLIQYDNPYEAVVDSDMVIIMTEWDIFSTLNYTEILTRMNKNPHIIDTRNIIDKKKLAKIGFNVYSLGRPM